MSFNEFQKIFREQGALEAKDIRRIIPHRSPFLLVDRVIEFEDNARIVSIKAVSGNEEFFQGHFPGNPVMPGVLMVEMIAQTGAILARLSENGLRDESNFFLVGANDVKWKKVVMPGETLRAEVKPTKRKGPFWILEGVITSDDKFVASATVSAMEVG